MPSKQSKYTCHSNRLGTASRESPHTIPNGYKYIGRKRIPLTKEHTTHWEKIPCGHINRDTDGECRGCVNVNIPGSNED